DLGFGRAGAVTAGGAHLSLLGDTPKSPQLGIRSWDIDLASCNLDEQLKLFVSRHSATFSSIVKGEIWDKKWGKKGENPLPGVSAPSTTAGTCWRPWCC
uniref:Microtubule-associated protein 1B/S N-terminal domain-containing protein n=1 Tax=Cyanistes caeruleus TaxID=156563 RepID=A0A8C0ZBB8_CYACU